MFISSQSAAEPSKVNDIEYVEYGYSFGAPDAPVTLIEYTNFQCSFCKQQHSELNAEVERLINNGKLYYVMKHVSIDDFENADVINESVNALSDKDSQLNAINSVFNAQAQWSGKRADELADFLKENKLTERKPVMIREELASEVTELGISSTPTTIINGQKFYGALKKEEFLKYIEKELY